MNDPLVGTKVRVIIEEDGTPNPPMLPPATILRKMGTDTGGHYLTRPDHPVKCFRGKTGEKWTLLNLSMCPRFRGGKLERTLTRNAENVVPIGISNVLAIESDSPILDPSKVIYLPGAL